MRIYRNNMNTLAVQEFKQIYKEEYGIELSEQEASQKASDMLNLFGMLTEDTKEGFNENK